jgi:MarR family transcriptional regulator, lower aerobic nicotinate degradation pathway regulator
VPSFDDVPPRDRRPVLTPLPGEGDLGLVDALAQLTFAVQGALGRIAAEYDVSVPAARLLGIVRDRQPTIGELATFLQLDKSSVTGLVDRAADRGLVVRTASPVDRRSVRVAITVAGRELIDQGAAALESEIAVLVADLTPAQRTRLSVIASRVVAADARRRGIDIYATADGDGLVGSGSAGVASGA